jgi:hypothetical protein
VTDAGFVITGWVLAAVTVAAYWARLVQRTRRARRPSS